MRKYQCHHYNSAIERVNLPCSQGGRGLCSFPLDHDRAGWLECSKQRRTVLKEARLILESHGRELEQEMWLKTDPLQIV